MASDLPQDDEDLPEPPQLKRLRWLVTALIVVLIGGVVTVVTTLVIRLGALTGPVGPLPPVSAEALLLPEGAEVLSLGRGPGEVLVLTRDADGEERLRAFDAETGAERSVTAVRRE